MRRRSYKMVACGALALTAAACSLTSPRCSDHDVRASIEKDARDSIDLWLMTSQSKALPANTRIVLSQTYETSRSGNTKACSATINVGIAKDAVAVPVAYQVIKSDDGDILYQWDKQTFGKALIGAIMESALSSMLVPQAKAPEASEQPNDEEPAAPPATSVPSMTPAQWRDEVTSEINVQAANVRIQGSGSVSIGFEVASDGTISNIRVLGSSGNASLDAAALQMAQKADHVLPPPTGQPTSLSIKLSFL